jgi:hypothetical protein
MATPTYHLAIWDTPPTYVCLLCNAASGLTFAVLAIHLETVHRAPLVPSPTIPALRALRAAADARAVQESS